MATSWAPTTPVTIDGGASLRRSPSAAAGCSSATISPAPATSVEQVAGELVGLHSSDPATVVLSLRARLDPFKVGDLEDALYERRSLLRMLAMRRTMFVVPLDLAAVMNASCTRALVPGERRKLVAMLEEGAVSDDVEALDRAGRRGDRRRAAHAAAPSRRASSPSSCQSSLASCASPSVRSTRR